MKQATSQDQAKASRRQLQNGSRKIRRMPIGGGHQEMIFRTLALALIFTALISAQDTPVSSPVDVASVQPTGFFMFNDPTAPVAAPVATGTTPTAPSPVASSSSSTSPTLSALTTPSPVSTPSSPESSPTSGSTGKLFNATGEVYIQLNYVGGNMSDDIVQQYEAQCTKFFNRILGNMTPPVLDIQSILVSQELLPIVLGSGSNSSASGNNSSARYLRLLTTTGEGRLLQQDLPPLLTLVRSSGKSESEANAKGMDDLLYYAVLNDPSGFAQSLTQATEVASLYFSLVKIIIPYKADDPNAGQPPQPVPSPSPPSAPTAPTKNTTTTPTNSTTNSTLPKNSTSNATTPSASTSSGDDTLEGGAIVAIVIAVVLWMAVVGVGLWYTLSPPPAAGAAAEAAPENREIDSQTRTATADSSKSGSGSRKVTIPPGKLGIMIGSGVQGPVVNKINPGSPLEGLLYPGDIILAVDNVDTRSMSASAVTEVTARTADQQRILTILSADGAAGAVSSKASSSVKQAPPPSSSATAGGKRVTRVVTAPPGKLGIVIDTTNDGPRIHKVHDGSPLEGLVFSGDIIVAIGDIDTTAMAASGITALMVKTANQERTLTVLSKENVGDAADAESKP